MMEFFYRAQTEQFESVDIPKELLTGKKFSSLSLAAKMLYAVLLAKMGDAAKNSWLDEENRVYIVYPLSSIEADINFSRHTVIDSMKELENIGLIHRHQEKGKPNRIYVKNFNKSRRIKMIG